MFYLTMQYMAGDDIQQHLACVMALNKCKINVSKTEIDTYLEQFSKNRLSYLHITMHSSEYNAI